MFKGNVLKLAVNVRLATLGMTAVTVILVMFVMEVIVEDVLMGWFLIQTKMSVLVKNPRCQKYWSMESAYVSMFTVIYIIFP